MSTTGSATEITTTSGGATGYTVLREQTRQSINTASSAPTGGWEIVNTVPAASAGAAIRKVVEKLAKADQDGTFVAVASRSWQPVKVTAKVTTAFVLEDVKP